MSDTSCITKRPKTCRLISKCRTFFFQAEDGIRDFHVTGVQTCALPIYGGEPGADAADRPAVHGDPVVWRAADGAASAPGRALGWPQAGAPPDGGDGPSADLTAPADNGAALRASGASLTAARPGDRSGEPGMVRRHYTRIKSRGRLLSRCVGAFSTLWR